MTIFALFDEAGGVLGFWDTDFISNSEIVPAEAIEITAEDRVELLSHPGERRWENGKVVVCEPPAVVMSDDNYRIAIQGHIDSRAREKQYDSGATLASYVNSTVSQWARDAIAFVQWRDAVWQYSFSELDKVLSGLREQPSVGSFIKELPELEWPSSSTGR